MVHMIDDECHFVIYGCHRNRLKESKITLFIAFVTNLLHALIKGRWQSVNKE